jgi:predicted DsbA family dithiol-disulfide isomerase
MFKSKFGIYLCFMKTKPVSILLSSAFFILSSCAQMNKNQAQQEDKNSTIQENKSNKMKVEIWSDLVCPFCYIGKRRFESALNQFAHANDVEVVWKSYQLNPNQVSDANKSAVQSLAESKGISLAEAQRLSDYVTEMALSVGLKYNFDKTLVANTLRAHQFTHFAKAKGKQNEAEEVLFNAYFIEGLNIDDINILAQLAEKIGLESVALISAIENGTYKDAVSQDIYEARQVGVQGVPFFLIDGKYAVSGAQESSTFLKTLEKAYKEFSKK